MIKSIEFYNTPDGEQYGFITTDLLDRHNDFIVFGFEVNKAYKEDPKGQYKYFFTETDIFEEFEAEGISICNEILEFILSEFHINLIDLPAPLEMRSGVDFINENTVGGFARGFLALDTYALFYAMGLTKDNSEVQSRICEMLKTRKEMKHENN